jgi:hypothetical protein
MTDIARKSLSAESVIETKTMEGFEIKNADLGEVTAVVSTMDIVDRDGDVILSGAIREGTVVKLSGYDHDVITEGKPPVGRGVITVTGNRAVLNAKYFMSTERGREAFNMVKELGPDSEWSIGFPKAVKTQPMTDGWKAKGARRLISGLNILESSPVFMGANAETGTVAVKQVETMDGKAIADREDASPQEGADKYGDVAFADPTNKKYPIDTEEHIRAAWNYINQQANADKYTPSEVAEIKKRIVAAWKDQIDKAGPPGAMPMHGGKSLEDVRLELKTARESVATLEREEANLVATEIFQRFQRNMVRAKA